MLTTHTSHVQTTKRSFCLEWLMEQLKMATSIENAIVLANEKQDSPRT